MGSETSSEMVMVLPDEAEVNRANPWAPDGVVMIARLVLWIWIEAMGPVLMMKVLPAESEVGAVGPEPPPWLPPPPPSPPPPPPPQPATARVTSRARMGAWHLA